MQKMEIYLNILNEILYQMHKKLIFLNKFVKEYNIYIPKMLCIEI